MIKLPPFFKKKEPQKPVSVLGLRKLNQKKNRRISKRKIFSFLLVLMIIFLILGIFLLIKNNPFQIKNINFKNADLSCVSNEQLKNNLNLTSYNFFTVDNKKLEQRVKEKFICVSSIEIKKRLPSTIEITANDRKFAAVIKVYQLPQLDLNLDEATSSTEAAKIIDQTAGSTESGNFIVDEEGVIIKPQENIDNLPIIDYYNQTGQLKIGSRIPDDLIAKTLKVLTGLNQQALVFNQVMIIDKGLFISGDKEIMFSLSGDIDRQLAALQLILQRATIDSKEVKKIDLRFDKAVVVYSAK